MKWKPEKAWYRESVHRRVFRIVEGGRYGDMAG